MRRRSGRLGPPDGPCGEDLLDARDDPIAVRGRVAGVGGRGPWTASGVVMGAPTPARATRATIGASISQATALVSSGILRLMAVSTGQLPALRYPLAIASASVHT